MIRVDRKRVSPPKHLQSPKAKAAMGRLEEFFALDRSARAQRDPRFDASIYSRPDVQQALSELFLGKCAYCETPLPGMKFMAVDQFRPRIRALNLDGALTLDGYWWLVYDWDNLYAVCVNCNRLKGTRFPIKGTARALPGTRGASLRDEQPLLLDPCEDEPQEHLVFSDDGRVASETDRGRTTIDILGLNRGSLVRDRRVVLETLALTLRTEIKKSKRDPRMLGQLAGDALPYAAARRQLIAAEFRERGMSLAEAAPAAGFSAVTLPDITKEKRQETVAGFRAAQQVQESYSVADEGSKKKYFARTRLIDRIEIHNFRPIENLTLAFPEPAASTPAAEVKETAGEAPLSSSWLMLLGENGAGKSSVLQAVALALIGEKWRNKFNFDASRFVRRGASEGYVRITMTGVEQPVELRFSSTSKEFTSEPKEPKLLLLGYGSTRLLPRPNRQYTATSYDFARIDNLFDPFEPLNDAATWLAGLPEEQFDAVARALRSILQLGSADSLVRDAGRIEADIFGSRVTFDELSDGYQTVVALATDIMRVMLHRWDAMEIAEGIVILDEIGSHLHPRWRMRIVDALRRAFPRIQFLVSTHDPLCLRGLAAGEVAVIARDASKHVFANTDLPPIGGLRVDQLLTSEYFGLNSTIDPAIEDLFSEYYKLLVLRKPTAVERKRLVELKGQLEQYKMLGANQRERLMLEAIDQFLADERATPSDSRVRLKAATRTKLAKIWASTPASPVRRGGTTA